MSRVMISTFMSFGLVLLYVHGCFKTMMGVNHSLTKEQSVCKTPQNV